MTTSLPEAVRRLEPARARSLSASMAPYLGRVGTYPPRYVEEAALTVLASVCLQAGPLREQLVGERAGFERLVNFVYRAPERRRGEP